MGAMLQTFKARIGYEIFIPVLLILIAVLAIPIFNGAPLIAVIVQIAIMLPIIAFTLSIFFGSTYKINDKNELEVRCGIILNSKVDISSIKSISKTHKYKSSPAPSIRRIELKYGHLDSVILSPKDINGFIKALQMINPNIKNQLS
tara:strand:+ start:943 stop:1380 length:438 start_codon:yes stop_codon:yes gene_type:complete